MSQSDFEMQHEATSKLIESLEKQVNKQAEELVVLRLKLADLLEENKRLRIERRILQDELTLARKY